MDSYANAPVSITEIRGDKEGDARKSLPRDALIAVLRQIDSGEMKVEAVAVIFRERLDDGKDYKTHFHLAGGEGMHDMLGLVERAKMLMVYK